MLNSFVVLHLYFRTSISINGWNSFSTPLSPRISDRFLLLSPLLSSRFLRGGSFDLFCSPVLSPILLMLLLSSPNICACDRWENSDFPVTVHPYPLPAPLFSFADATVRSFSPSLIFRSPAVSLLLRLYFILPTSSHFSPFSLRLSPCTTLLFFFFSLDLSLLSPLLLTSVKPPPPLSPLLWLHFSSAICDRSWPSRFTSLWSFSFLLRSHPLFVSWSSPDL